MILLTLYIFSTFIITVYSINVSNNYSDELKIIITNVEQLTNQPTGFGRGFNLLPISMDVIDQLLLTNNVVDVVPIIDYIKYNFSDDFPQKSFPSDFNGTIPTNDFNKTMPSNGFPNDFNGTMPPIGFNFDNRFQETADYIVEGMPLSSEYVGNYLIPSFNLKEGDSFDKNDSSVAIIGLDAAEYFQIYIGENISIDGFKFRVKGIVDNSEYSKYIFMNITDAQMVCGLNVDEVNTLYIYIDDESYLDNISTEIINQFPTFRTRYIGQQPDYPLDRNRNDNQDSNEKSVIYSPGFEIGLLIFVIGLIIIYKKNKRR